MPAEVDGAEHGDREPGPERDPEAAAEAEQVEFNGVPIRVPRLTALLVYKMLASRPQDLQDVSALLKTGPFDRAQVADLLREFDALLETSRAEDFERILRDSE